MKTFLPIASLLTLGLVACSSEVAGGGGGSGGTGSGGGGATTGGTGGAPCDSVQTCEAGVGSTTGSSSTTGQGGQGQGGQGQGGQIGQGGASSGISGCEYESGTGSVGAGAPKECVSTYQCDQGQVDITCAESPTGVTCTCVGPSGAVECDEPSFACADLEASCCAALL